MGEFPWELCLQCYGNMEFCGVFQLFGKTSTSASCRGLWGGPCAGGGIQLWVSVMPDPAVDEEALPGWDLHAPLGAGLSAAPFFSPLPDFPTPDRHLWHQLLHLSPECVLPADEEHHQVRSGGITPK